MRPLAQCAYTGGKPTVPLISREGGAQTSAFPSAHPQRRKPTVSQLMASKTACSITPLELHVTVATDESKRRDS